MNWNATQLPKSDIAARFARTSEPERRIPSRTSGALVRRSCTTNAARIAAAPAKESSVRAEAQPACGASTSVKTRSSMAAVIVTAPVKSKPRRMPGTLASAGTSFVAARSATRATTVGTKKTQRQPASVSRPPSTRPSEKPVAPVAV